MKRNIAFFVGVVLILAPAISGRELLSERVEIGSCDDLYSKDMTVPLFVKTDNTYTEENRTIQISIEPQIPRKYEEDGYPHEDRSHFLQVFVSVMFSDAKGDVLKQVKGCLNYKECSKPGQLFWGCTDEESADLAGSSFEQGTPLVVEDEYLMVTVALTEVSSSSYPCIPASHLPCDSDSQCLVYMDTLTLQVTVAYSSAQEKVRSSFEEASSLETSAADLFKRGETEKAGSECQEAKKIYDQLGATVKTDFCKLYITAREAFDEGERLLREARETRDYEEAIEKYKSAQSYFERAQDQFKKIGAIAETNNCKRQIEQCNRGISELERKSKMRTRLIYIVAAAVVVVGAGVAASQMKKKPLGIPAKEDTTLLVPRAEGGKTVLQGLPVEGRGPRVTFGSQEFVLHRDSMTIGRGEDADIRVPDPENRVSRIHARIYSDERGQYWLADNNSANGTYIFDHGEYRRIKKWILYDGDVIILAYDPSKSTHVTLQFKAD